MKSLLVVILVGVVAYTTYAISSVALTASEKDPDGSTTLRVKVLDASEEVVTNASVSVRSDDGQIATTKTVADTSSSYLFKLPVGGYDVVATTEGGRVASQSVILKSGQVQQVTLTPLER